MLWNRRIDEDAPCQPRIKYVTCCSTALDVNLESFTVFIVCDAVIIRSDMFSDAITNAPATDRVNVP